MNIADFLITTRVKADTASILNAKLSVIKRDSKIRRKEFAFGDKSNTVQAILSEANNNILHPVFKDKKEIFNQYDAMMERIIYSEVSSILDFNPQNGFRYLDIYSMNNVLEFIESKLIQCARKLTKKYTRVHEVSTNYHQSSRFIKHLNQYYLDSEYYRQFENQEGFNQLVKIIDTALISDLRDMYKTPITTNSNLINDMFYEYHHLIGSFSTVTELYKSDTEHVRKVVQTAMHSIVDGIRDRMVLHGMLLNMQQNRVVNISDVSSSDIEHWVFKELCSDPQRRKELFRWVDTKGFDSVRGFDVKSVINKCKLKYGSDEIT